MLEPNARFVPLAGLPLRIGRAPDMDLRLTERTVSRFHAVLEWREGILSIRDVGSRFGTYVNGQRIRERRLELEDHIRFGQVVAYRLGRDGLYLVEEATQGLRLFDLEIAAGKRVLVNFRGWSWNVPPGHLVAILGPSGAGKSMLLRTIAGIRRPARGIIAYGDLSNIWEEIESYRRRLAYIPQDDVVYGLLSVEENLRLAAQLRLNTNSGGQSWKDLAEKSLEFFGLKEHRGKLVRVLSGGQRKRLSVALEWLRGPQLFLLDEPSSGLDPANEARLMENLRELAAHGATVLCATHLMEHIYLVDEVLVLGLQNGQAVPAYAGDPAELLNTLGCRNFADLYERLERGEFEPVAAPQPISPEAAKSSSDSAGGGDSRSAVSATSTRRSLKQLAIPPAREVDPIAIKVVAQRTWLQLWRDPWMRLMLLGQPVILATVLALTQFNPGKILSALFFTTVVACWLGMNNSIRDLVQDRKGYIRDRLVGLPPASYLLAKWIVFGAIGVCQLLVFLVLVRLLVPLVLPETLKEEFFERSFLAWWGTLWLVYLGGLGLALTVSALVESEQAAVAWLPILILPQILLSAVATGTTPLRHSDARPFRPIMITLQYPTTEARPTLPPEEREKLSLTALVVDTLSLVLVCRPAVLILERPRVEGFGGQLWAGDLCHLLLLIFVQLLLLWLVFLWRERYWPALIGY